MARISLWDPQKGNDFNFIDKNLSDNFRQAGDGILIHLYEGPTTTSTGSPDTSLTTIQDVLFLANNNRIYDPNVIELKGHHVPTDVNYDLSQFGVLLSSDVIRVMFHYKDMMDSLGRKLIAGDVLEFPSMVDIPIFNNATGINRYYVVQDALWAANGYGPKWFPHIWLVRAKLLQASVEYQQITNQAATGQTQGGVGQGIGIMPEGFTDTADSSGNPGTGCNPNITNSLNLFCQIIGLSQEIVAEAQQDAFFNPKFFESANLYIYLNKQGYPILGSSNFFSGDGAPPNTSPDLQQDLVPSGPLVGAGIQFPPGMLDGQYYLRLDYTPERLFQKQGNIFKFVEENILRYWVGYNLVLDSFINNNKQTILPDGTSVPEKQAVSQVLKQKVDLYANRRTQTLDKQAKHATIADQQAANENINPATGAAGGLTNPYPSTPVPGNP